MLDISLLSVENRIALLLNALSGERDHKPVVKLSLADGSATWLLTECDPDEPDRLFGLCDLGLGCPELGFVSLAEILGVRGHLGLRVERDQHFVATKSITEYAEEARAKGRVVT